MQKYTANPKLKDYLVKKAYKETQKWKAGKKKRMIWGYGGLAAPAVLFLVLLLVSFLTGKTVGQAIVYAAPVPLILMIVCWPVAIMTLKVQVHNAKLIPEDRKYDEVIFDEKQMTYTYACLSDGYMYETIIRYSDIIRLQHSVMRKTFFVFAGYRTKITKNGKVVHEIRLGKDSGQYIVIPLYFTEADAMMKNLSENCGIELERIEEV